MDPITLVGDTSAAGITSGSYLRGLAWARRKRKPQTSPVCRALDRIKPDPANRRHHSA
jgi:hypothetical protein